jgi:hypothetical protein
MMTDDDYQHFVCIVAGDNPDDLIRKYSKLLKEGEYVVYHYKDAHVIKQKYIQAYEDVLEKYPNYELKTEIQATIDDLRTISDDEFYASLTAEYKKDEKTNDALSTENRNGKYTFCNIGKVLSVPFLTKDGREVFKIKKNEVDWDNMHLNGGYVYSRVWEMVMENSEPKDNHEQVLYDNMKDKIPYFNKFETKENYITSNTAFWAYAFLSEETGWVDAISENTNQFEWMSNYYDKFIKNLPDDKLLTIYECHKYKKGTY